MAADPAVAMLAEARRRHPGTPAVACEVEALPLRRGAVAGVWASKCLQHVPAERLPAALGEVHRVLPVGGLLDLTVFDAGGPPGTTVVTGADDDIPGRLFASWDAEALGHLLTGAGFTVDEVAAVPGDPWGKVVARARRARTLADTVGPGMRVLACGLNPSLYSADAGVGFARPGNRFWPAALAAGLASAPRDPAAALRDHGLGMTDVVKRATVAAAELTRDEYRAGLDRVRWLVVMAAAPGRVLRGPGGMARGRRPAGHGRRPTRGPGRRSGVRHALDQRVERLVAARRPGRAPAGRRRPRGGFRRRAMSHRPAVRQESGNQLPLEGVSAAPSP